MTSHINVVSRSPSYDNSDEPPLRRLSTTEILYDIEQRNNANQENIINEILLNIETNLNNDEKIQLIRRLETTILSQYIPNNAVGFIRDYDEKKRNNYNYSSPFSNNIKTVYIVEDHYDDDTVTIRDINNNQARVHRRILTRFTE